MDPIREVAEAIVNLGIADERRLAPFIRASRDRSLGESTQDGTDEVSDFLDRLSMGGVLDAGQRKTVERILSGEKTPRAAPPPETPDPYLDRKFGAFTAIRKIGEGGMGAVYRAEREDDGSRAYVVKVLSPLAADQATYVRFHREGVVMAALRHPNVVRVFESGETEGLSWIVMEFVDGPTLQDMFEQKQRFEWVNAAKAARQIALGLEAAHAIGVIHRDVKPQNVFLSKAEGLLKVGDFGLAKIHREPSDPSISRAGDILGSPAYIAPEQWGDHDVDPRADLFALGIILYQLVTGVLPFRGRTPSEYAKKILSMPFDPVELYAPDCPEGVKNIIARLLEKKREHRYSTAGQVVADIERALRNELPDIPRIVRAQGAPERWPLIGRDEFALGRAPKAQIVVNHPSIADHHATLVRTNAGITLRENEGRGQVRVNGMRVRDIALKDGDVIELGDAPPLRYKAGASSAGPGAVPSGQSPSSGKLRTQDGKPAPVEVPPVAAPGPLYEAFLREEHPRAVLALVELLDEATHERRVARSEKKLLAAGLDAGTVGRAVERARASYRRIAALLPDRIFRATHENLGTDPATWLGWWFTSGSERFPPQVLPPGPRATAVLAIFEEDLGTTHTADLTGVESWTIGRGSECAVRLYDRSVSRKHATIHRLLTRFAIRDEGSRFGTAVRGERRPVALLRHDDQIELGRARLIFRQPVETAPGDPQGIDPVVFDALVEMRTKCVQGALVHFIDPALGTASIVASKWVAQGDEDPVKIAKNLLEDRKRQALEALPPISRKDLGADPAAWREWWRSEKASAGPQVHPEGWSIED